MTQPQPPNHRRPLVVDTEISGVPADQINAMVEYEQGEWEPKVHVCGPNAGCTDKCFDLDAPGTRKKVYATTLGWYDLHTPDNGINTIAAEAARLEQECGVKLHTLKYNGLNHGYEPTFISENITDIVCLLATDEGGGINDEGELSLTNGTIVEVTL